MQLQAVLDDTRHDKVLNTILLFGIISRKKFSELTRPLARFCHRQPESRRHFYDQFTIYPFTLRSNLRNATHQRRPFPYDTFASLSPFHMCNSHGYELPLNWSKVSGEQGYAKQMEKQKVEKRVGGSDCAPVRQDEALDHSGK